MADESEGKGAAFAAYDRGRRAHAAIVDAQEGRARRVAMFRLLVAAAVLAVLAGIVWGRWGTRAWAGMGALVVSFGALVVVHARIEKAKDRAVAAVRFHARGLARIALDWAALPQTSERFRAPSHPFAGDLDVFGRASLMQVVDATETRFGEERLAALFSAARPQDPWPAAVADRAAAARELAERFSFREALAVAAGVLGDEKPDPSPLLVWAEGAEAPPPPWLRAIAWLVPAVALAAIVAEEAGVLSVGQVTVVVILAIGVGLSTGVRLNQLLTAVSAGESTATRWRAALATIEGEAFAAPRLAALRATLRGEGRAASDEMAALERIVGYVDARRNEIFRFFIGPVLMWDVHCAVALFAWRRRAGRRLRSWLEAIGEVEALASLGAFAFEHPDFAWPSLEAEPMLLAESLGHPLIAPDRRIGNDVRLAARGRALVVTGSNMSGKSTLLRALGVNTVLALAGAPVCARSMRVGPLRVATSMRIEDSLSYGVSHFYAEVARLKSVLDGARTATADSSAELFLLDEILHGTNSRERVQGARAVVRELLERGALGAVSTHDLGITALEDDLAGRVENVHFEEQVRGAEMTFDYALRPGVVQSSNAVRLMRAMGIDVPDPPGDA